MNAPPDVFGDTPHARARIRRLRRLDRLVAGLITAGGVGIILAVFGIFFFIGKEALPLLIPADVEPAGIVAGGGVRALAIGEDEYREKTYALTEAGTVRLFDTASGRMEQEVALEGLGGARVTAGARAMLADVVAAATSDGRVLLAGIAFEPDFSGGRRSAQTIRVDWQAEVAVREAGRPIERIALAADGEQFVVAAAAEGYLAVAQRKIGGRSARVGDASSNLPPGAAVTAIALDEAGTTLAVGYASGGVARFELAREEATIAENLAAGTAPVTGLGYVLGGLTLLVGDATGQVSGWQGLRTGGSGARTMSRTHEFEAMDGAVLAFMPSRRNKAFLVLDAGGRVRLDHRTTVATLAEVDTVAGATALAIAPRFDGIAVAGADGAIHRYALDAPHPETSLRTLFSPVQYEGYDTPDYTWQSSSGTDDTEAKLSLIPLIVGSLKGVLYAMLFSAPLAILAALYVSQFASHRLRGTIKPTVELMGALPSVVVGFLAFLWLSPMLDQHMVTALLLLLLLPLSVAIAVACYRLMSKPQRQRFALGRELGYLVPFLLGGGAAALLLGTPLEGLLFDGDMRSWLQTTLGVAYDPSNAVVVGLALGFAVIPIIFTVAEDAMSNVPRALRAASDALGASRWQTAWRLVLPASSPGIFAGIMLGFGRAVGETMIVVMASGSTPLLDLSPFNGMRTISASIAIEIPEAAVHGTQYRVLFLAGAILFLIAFAANTLAETVGERLRRRFARW